MVPMAAYSSCLEGLIMPSASREPQQPIKFQWCRKLAARQARPCDRGINHAVTIQIAMHSHPGPTRGTSAVYPLDLTYARPPSPNRKALTC